MIDDSTRLAGVVEVTVTLTDLKGSRTESKLLECNNYSLSDVGTVVQREAYELLRMVAADESRN